MLVFGLSGARSFPFFLLRFVGAKRLEKILKPHYERMFLKKKYQRQSDLDIQIVSSRITQIRNVEMIF